MVDDPLASRSAGLLARLRSPEEKVRALLSMREIFAEKLAADDRFVAVLVQRYSQLQGRGASATVERLAMGANS